MLDLLTEAEKLTHEGVHIDPSTVAWVVARLHRRATSQDGGAQLHYRYGSLTEAADEIDEIAANVKTPVPETPAQAHARGRREALSEVRALFVDLSPGSREAASGVATRAQLETLWQALDGLVAKAGAS